MQEPIISQIRREGRRTVVEIFEEMQAESEGLVDLHRLTVDTLTRDGGRSFAGLIRRIASRELRFIELYGALFGALIGAFEALLWGVFQTWWLLPLVGGVVGVVTNWLAIQMIFRPQQPQVYLGFIHYQGLFPMRQNEIAADYAQVCADEIVTPRNLIGMLTEGEGGQRLVALITDTLREKYDDQVRLLRGGPLSEYLVEPTLNRIRETVVDEVMKAAPAAQPELETYLAQKLDVAETLRGRLQQLSKSEFERILRGIFEEDELTLVMLGGFLGAVIGLIQGVIMGAFAL